MHLINEKHLAIAKVCYAANKAWCEAHSDFSQPEWADAPDWMRETVLLGVAGALNGATPEQSHESWLAEKERTGWVYGPVKDEFARTHPCMVPYGQLDEEQRRKDHLFVAIVRALG